MRTEFSNATPKRKPIADKPIDRGAEGITLVKNEAAASSLDAKFALTVVFIGVALFFAVLAININTMCLNSEAGTLRAQIVQVKENTQTIRSSIDPKSAEMEGKAKSFGMVQREKTLVLNIGKKSTQNTSNAMKTETNAVIDHSDGN
jgi:hypothetical protein